MKELQRKLIAAYVTIVPVAYTIVDTRLRLFQESLWHYFAMGVIVSFCRNVYLFSFFSWSLLLLYLNNFEVGKGHVFNLFLGICLFSCSRAYFKHFRFDEVSRPLLWVGLLTICWMTMQLLGIDPLYIGQTNAGQPVWDSEFRQQIGLFGLKAHNGIFLALLIPILARVNIILAIALFIPIITSDSSAAILAGLVGFLFYIWYENKKLMKFILPIVVVAGLVFVAKDYNSSNGMMSSRFNLWHAVFKFSLARPIGYGPDSFNHKTDHKDILFFGDDKFNVGIGMWNEERQAYGIKQYDPNFYKMQKEYTARFEENPVRWTDPHNIIMNILFEYGIPGLIIFGAFINEMVCRFITTMKTRELVIVTSMILVFFVASLSQFPLYTTNLGFIAPLLIGAFYSLTDKKEM